MANIKVIRIMVDVVVPEGTDPKTLANKKVGEQIAKFTQAVALPSVKVKPEDTERRVNIHTHTRGCNICESEAPYKYAHELPNK